MNPYDALIKQLEEAREQGLESVKDRLGGILDNLEHMSSSIRDALADADDEVFQLGEIPAAIAGLRAEAEAAAEVPPPTVTLEVLRNLDGARTQSDLLNGLLKELSTHAGRAVVLVFRPDGMSAWSAVGFDDASQLERWSCGKGESELLDGFVEAPEPRCFDPADDPVVARWIEGESKPTEAMLVPVSLRGKTMGAVYVDRLDGAPWDPDAVQILVAISCWMIDTLKYRSASGSPMLGAIAAAITVDDVIDAVADEAAPEAVTEEEVEVEPVAEEEFEPDEEAEDVAAAPVDEEAVEPEPEPAADEAAAEETALGEMASEPDFDPSATVQVEPDEPVEEPVTEDEPTDDVPEFEVSEEVAEVAIEEPVVEHEEPVVEDEAETYDEPEAAAEEAGDEESELPLPPPVQPVVPPADFEETPGFEVEAPAADAEAPPISAEDESQHEEARRFARLLVSEIKLYNEDAVERGREQNDLYARLKEDIDRSREMYERRIPAEIRTARDYFHEELVRILADGNNDALGM